MKYRVKKNQLFRKKLEMPESLLNKVYSNTLGFEDYIEYNLVDKVPLSCLNEIDRFIVEKFGIEKSKTIDWELINLKGFELSSTLEDIDVNSNTINEELYRFVREDMLPKDYTKMMKETFSEFVLDDDKVSVDIQNQFNSGYLKVNELVAIWDSVKDKDLKLCLKNDATNKENVTEEELKKFMKEYDGLLSLLEDPEEIYDLIITAYREEDSNIDEYIKKIVTRLLDKTLDEEETFTLTNEQYKKIFKYVPMKDYLDKKIGEEHADNLIKEVKDIHSLFDLIIPFNVLMENDVIAFVEIYGLKNLVHFEEESGPFFTDNDCELLRNAYDIYVKYGANETDKNKSIFTKNPYGITGNYIERGYTKEEFNEAVRRMIIYGPTNPKYKNSNIDYSIIKGEFRELNSELFVDNKLPEDFKKAFYTKKLTPLFARDHYNCISYLIGKKLSTIFSPLYVRINSTEEEYYYRHVNVYEYLESKLGFEDIIRIITDYADVFDIVFGSYDKICKNSYVEPIQFNDNDTYDTIITKLDNKIYELIIKANIKYSSNLSKSMKESYPNVFISYKAPQELHDKFYDRKIDAKYIINHPEEKKFFDGLDIELFFNYMPIVLVSNDSKKQIQNLVLFVKNLFDNEEGLDILLAYYKYLDKVNDKFGFSKVEFRDSITKEEFLVQVDCLIYLNIIRGDIIYDENMPTHFKSAYPSLFLTSNTPDEIKYNFYNRFFKLEDFYDNPVLLKHFANTDIACCLDTTFSSMIGLFESDEFLEIIKICGENIKSETKLFNYIRTKTEDTINIKAFSKYIYDYYNENDECYRYIVLASNLGLSNKKIEEVKEKVDRVIKLNPELNIYGSNINPKLLTDSVIKDYGYDVINSVLKYNTTSYKTLLDSIKGKDKKLKQWIDYLKSLPIYNENILHSALVSYHNMDNIINNLLDNGNDLSDIELESLKDIINNNNRYDVNTITNLNNYSKIIKKNIADKIKSDNIDIVRDGVFIQLFNMNYMEIKNVFDKYGLFNKLYREENLDCLSIIDKSIIVIIENILAIDDIDLLKDIYEDIKDIGYIFDGLNNLEDKLIKHYSSKIKDSLFDYKKDDDVKTSKIPVLEDTFVTDINDNYVLDTNEIKTIELNGEPFNILLYCLNKDIKPNMWNTTNNNILSMNIISNTNIGCINHGSSDSVYYGFYNITQDTIIFENRRDIELEYRPIDFSLNNKNSEYMIPDMLSMNSLSYNTIGVNISSSDSSKYNHRLQPDYIVCFDNMINDESKLAAEYFNIPICIINRDKYNLINSNKLEKYQDKDYIVKRTDVKDIFMLNNYSFENKYNLVTESLDTDNTKLVNEIKKIVSEYSIYNDISDIDITKLEVSNVEEGA